MKIPARKRKDQRVNFGREEWSLRRWIYGLSSLNLPGVDGRLSRCDNIGFNCVIFR
jgi:hypothetical protein